MQLTILLAFQAASIHSWLTGTPKSFSIGLLLMSSSLSLYSHLGLPQPKSNTSHVALLNLIRFSYVHFFSLFRFLWTSPSSIVSTAALSLLSLANLLRVCSTPLSTSLIRMLKSTCPKMGPCRTPLVTSLHLDTEPWTPLLWLRLSKQLFIQLTVQPSNSSLSNFEIRMWCGIMSKPLHKSRYMTSVALPLSTNTIAPL